MGSLTKVLLCSGAGHCLWTPSASACTSAAVRQGCAPEQETPPSHAVSGESCRTNYLRLAASRLGW